MRLVTIGMRTITYWPEQNARGTGSVKSDEYRKKNTATGNNNFQINNNESQTKSVSCTVLFKKNCIFY